MKNLFALLTILAFHQLGTFSQMTERDTVFHRFRSVVLQNNKSIDLQANVKYLKDITIKSNDNHYYLRKGSFIRADSIDIEVNKKGQITVITFVYPGTDYQSMQKIYSKPLGMGKEFVYASEELKIDVTQWKDEKTIFELVKVVSDKSTVIYSVITDKQLYYEKIKNCFNLNKSENSIEILKKLGLI